MSSAASSPAQSRTSSPARSRSSSRSSSRSRSASRSSSRSPQGSPARSPAVSATRSRSPSSSPVSSSSSAASSRSPSPEPVAKLKVKIKDRKKSATPRREEDEGAGSQSEDEETISAGQRTRPGRGGAKPVANKKKAPAEKKKAAPVEEGEVSDSDKEFDDGLDDDLIGDDEDRALLAQMTEREREQELFKRAEIRENLRKKFEIKKRLKQQQKLKGPEVKSAPDEDDDDDDDDHNDEDEDRDGGAQGGPGVDPNESMSDDDFDTNQMLDAKERSQDRKRNLEQQKFDKKSMALNKLKAINEERQRKEKEKEKQRELDRETKDSESSTERGRSSDKRKTKRSSSSSGSEAGSYRRRSSSSSSSSRSRSRSRSSSSSGSDTERFRKAPKVEKFVETMEDLEPIRLSRTKIERFLFLPHFRNIVNGCFVRIGIGNNPAGQSVYRCTEVVEVVETAKVYQLGKTKTNQGLKLKFGKQERVFRLQFISNSPLTPTEFEKWKYTCQENQISLPTKDFVHSKSQEIKKAMTYEYSSADVDAMIQKNEKFNKNPVNYAMKKANLMKEKEIALSDHNDEKANQLEQELKELEETAEKLNKRRNHNTKFNSISFINDRNRKNNVWKAEEAIKQEILRKKEMGVEDNPFLRRKCNPRMVTKSQTNVPPELLKAMAANEKFQQELKDKLEKENEKKRRGDDLDGPDSKKKGKLGGSGASLAGGKEDIFDAHDFDIEIDVGIGGLGGGPGSGGGDGPSTAASEVVPSPRAMPTAASISKTSGPARRSLNLADYKKKRGLI
ncbi:hypothetical protein TCAL_08119 [Tigriopus californicus]|uniref:Plus3 domain-containing protein n=1 Tax=Tigriopus californicus TaxID=6832 RepID=A0A553PJP0_TIGCA|nr:RNA polymerase-associated protein Rtf1-like [Tigriopus californicus]TRY77906.1 hypothetical protein TCAL_08119 [Tigriopus californicus]|eukprot:TCALIF_08119-PA protein Name:"Similar to Rtf1 RNA polymerase-associated protein Rtf1 (Drosophila melanogaster)" AED:0.29 eAED:0.29 QI:0/-1/0/1/-1/1/1/0/787